MANAIAFTSGCYGGWVHWLVCKLSGLDVQSEMPFNADGSAHAWYHEEHQHIGFIDALSFDIESLSDTSICRIHPLRDPISNDDDAFLRSIQQIIDSFDRTVYLYADIGSVCWILNTMMDKCFNKNQDFKDFFNLSNLKSGEDFSDLNPFVFRKIREDIANWPKEVDDADVVSRWIVREFMSINIKNIVHKLLGISSIENIKSLDLLAIDVADLRDNFTPTILKILNYLIPSLQIDEARLDKLYSSWSETQKHLYKDELLTNIVDSTIGGTDLTWADLTLADEAMIQHLLREKNYDLRCHGLNEFPTNSKHLRELIYVTQ